MRHLILIAILVLFIFTGVCQAVDLTVLKIITVDSADPAPSIRPLKWSPDGSQLSYLQQGYLMVWDTLGNINRVKEIEMAPERYEWLSIDEIIISTGSLNENISTRRLSIIDIDDGTETILKENTRDVYSPVSEDTVQFEGPFLTLEGNPYYQITDETGGLRLVIPQSKYKQNSKAISLPENHVLHWGKDGLYLVKADFSDSTRLAPKPYPTVADAPAINLDRSYIMVGGTIERLADSVIIILDTLVKDGPPKAQGCGFHFGSFNPAAAEVLFEIGCPREETFIGNKIGTFDYLSNRVTILDTLVGIDNCTFPVYAPDGRRIAFIADRQAYIIFRGEKKE
jgi:WD40-like Beta Propeller Repeat